MTLSWPSTFWVRTAPRPPGLCSSPTAASVAKVNSLSGCGKATTGLVSRALRNVENASAARGGSGPDFHALSVVVKADRWPACFWNPGMSWRK